MMRGLSAAGIEICQVDQLRNAAKPIADQSWRIATDCGNNSLAYDGKSILFSQDESFDNDHVAELFGGGEGREHLLAGVQIERYPRAAVGVTGFDDDGEPDLASHRPGFVGGGCRTAPRDW